MGKRFVSRRRLRGAAISEYLPIVGLIVTILVGGIAQYSQETRKHAAQMSMELAGIGSVPALAGGSVGGGSQASPGGDAGAEAGAGNGSGSEANQGDGAGAAAGGGHGTAVDGAGDDTAHPDGHDVISGGDGNSAGDPTGDEHAGGLDAGDESLFETVGQFISGLWSGVKMQFWGLVEMALSPIETLNGFKELAVAFATEPAETLKVLVDVFKEDGNKLLHGSAFDKGEVIGEYISPSTLTAVVNRLRSVSKIANSVRRQDAAKKLDTDCSSFLAGTLVWTPDGLAAIENLRVGDRVHARHDESFADAPQRISQLLRRDVDRYYELDTGYETLRVTGEHPVWLQGQGWTPVSKLKVGDVLARARGDIQIHKLKFVQGPASVYNFTVEKTHNYFVGPNKLWVHNANGPCPYNPGPSKTSVDSIAQTVPAHLREAFQADFKDPKLADALLKNPDLAKSWVVSASRAEIRKDLPTLNKLDSLLKDRDILDVLGEQGLKDIMDKAVNPINGGNSSLVSLTRHLDNIQIFVKNHNDVPGFDKAIHDLKSGNFYMQKGTSHALEVMRQYPKGSIKKMDMTFEADGLSCSNCRFDLELDPLQNGGLRYVEFKSYKLESVSKLPVNQLKAYFAESTNIGEMKYIFNKLDTPDVSDVKKQMQKVFEKNADDIFKAMNPNMRNSLKITSTDDLLDLIENINSQFYSFIGIQ